MLQLSELAARSNDGRQPPSTKLMPSHVKPRKIVIHGHPTSVRLGVRMIAAEHGMTACEPGRSLEFNAAGLHRGLLLPPITAHRVR
jgi:hypothetical protein